MMSFGYCGRAMFATTLIFGSLCSTCLGQQSDAPVAIPAQVISGLVYIQGEVNNSAPLSVILDSGASVSIVNPPVAQTLGLTSTHSSEASGIAKGSDQTLHFVDDCELKWGSPDRQLSLLHQQSAILPIDYISTQVGKRVDALFGSNLFLHYMIAVDYEQQSVTFSSPGSGTPPLGSSVPIQILGNDSYVEASIEGEDGKKVAALFVLDSGTTGAMILNRKFLDAHPGLIGPTHFVETPAVTAVGGVIRSKRVRLPKVGLGPFLLSGVVAVVPESSTGVLSNATVAGFIGAGILQRFTVTWDYTGNRIFLSPNRTFGEPFEADASGLHLESPGPQYQMVEIDSVLPGSPAAHAGLEPGDEILAVDGASGLPLWKVSEAFRKAGTSVVLKVQRKTSTLEITLPLRSPFNQTI
jgi:hypothetical protein